MKPDDSQLIAYADGELSATEAEAVERALAESADLRESVELLRASRLPYREAFAVQKLPPLPDALRRRIDAMASASQQPDTGPAGIEPATEPAIEPAMQAARRSQPRVWLAAAFVAGAFCAGLVHQLNGLRSNAPVGQAATGAAGNGRSWMSVAADYQQMYTRETIAHVTPDPAISAATADAIRKVDGIRLRMPDLRRAGLSFKSVERLRFNGKPLVQIVYLPDQGTPVALCVMKDTRPDQSIAQKQMNGMTVVSWRQNELAYALIGKPDSGDLQTLARQISDGDVDAMFAATGTGHADLG